MTIETEALKTFNPVDADPEGYEQYIRQFVVALGFADEPDEIRFPVTTTHVAELLNGMQYDIDDAKGVNRIVQLGWIPAPQKNGKAFTWFPEDIARLQVALESRGKWQTESDLHDHKKTMAQRGRELAELKGLDAEPKEKIRQHSISDIVSMLVDCGDRATREQLQIAFKIRCEQMQVTDDQLEFCG